MAVPVIEQASSKHSGRYGNPNGPVFGVLHSAECPLQRGYARSLGQWGATSGVLSSWHEFVGPEEVTVMGPYEVVRWHATVANPYGLGFEQAGYARYSRTEWLSPLGRLQFENLAQRMARAAKKYDWPLRWLTLAQFDAAMKGKGHGGLVTHEIVATWSGENNRTDPGDHYPYDELLARIKEIVGGKVTVTPATPVKAAPNPQVNKGRKLHLPGSATRWAVYPTSVAPVIGNQSGWLNPSLFGGLTYDVVRMSQANVAVIKTRDFGDVQIYVHPDTGATFSGSAPAKKPAAKTPAAKKKQTVTLPASAATWGIYRQGVQPVSKNIFHQLTPAAYGGLTYEVKGWTVPGQVALIDTAMFGRVQIYVAKGTGAILR